MDEKLQETIQEVCSGLTTHDVNISQIFDMRRFARMAHYAWKNEIGFNPEMFKSALKETPLFSNLSDDVLDIKAKELCHHADFAKGILNSVFKIDKLPV